MSTSGSGRRASPQNLSSTSGLPEPVRPAPGNPDPDPEWAMPPMDGPPSGTGDFARSVSARSGPKERLERGVDLVVELVEGCDHAGVTVAEQRFLLIPAASDDVVRRGDTWQRELGEGPCLDSIRYEHTILCQDLEQDPRWPRWSRRVRSELGVRAMLSLLLFTGRDTYGALNLYADRPGVWEAQNLALAYALAGHLAVAVADAREIDHRGRAMVSRTVIGQAEGILMERFGLDADHAFAYLRRVSQNQHRKLVDVAVELVATRRLPDLPARPEPPDPSGRPATPD